MRSRALLLALCLAAAVASRAAAKTPDEDLLGDYALLHGFAHFGAGALVGMGTHCLLVAGGVAQDHPLIDLAATAGSALLIGYLKEAEDPKFNYQQMLSTGAGGLAVGLTVNFYRISDLWLKPDSRRKP